MTVIAWDGYTLASDRRCLVGSTIYEATKIARIGHLLVGGSGPRHKCVAMMDWIEHGCVRASFPACQASDPQSYADIIVVRSDGWILRYDYQAIPHQYPSQKMAIGSGRDVALAAMHCGKTAVGAVLLTSQLISTCGNGVDALSFGETQ